MKTALLVSVLAIATTAHAGDSSYTVQFGAFSSPTDSMTVEKSPNGKTYVKVLEPAGRTIEAWEGNEGMSTSIPASLSLTAGRDTRLVIRRSNGSLWQRWVSLNGTTGTLKVVDATEPAPAPNGLDSTAEGSLDRKTYLKVAFEAGFIAEVWSGAKAQQADTPETFSVAGGAGRQ